MGIDCDNEEENVIDTIDGKLLRGPIAIIYILLLLIFNQYTI